MFKKWNLGMLMMGWLVVSLLVMSCDLDEGSSGESDPDNSSDLWGYTDGDADMDADADSDADADGDSDSDSDMYFGDCMWGQTTCDMNIVQYCDNGVWVPWDDCTIRNEICTVLDGTFQCVDPYNVDDNYNQDCICWEECDCWEYGCDCYEVCDCGGWGYTDGDADSDADSDSDSDADGDWDFPGSECDGYNVDCYSECWGCAITTVCASSIENCLYDTASGGCADYYTCKEEVCCNGNNSCLAGDEWQSCMESCEVDNGTTPEALQRYNEIDECVACDACSLSCAQNESQDFPMCGGTDQMINSATNPCYAEDAVNDDIACYSWAGWGGPCTAQTQACKENPGCDGLEMCINDSWMSDNWMDLQEECFAMAGQEAEDLYWGYQQCIYCDACDLACAADAGTKNCDSYNGPDILAD